MTVEARLLVEGTLIGNADLVDGIVVNLRGERILFPLGFRIVGSLYYRGCQRVERQTHEDAVEPHLIRVDGLVPIDLVGLCARLVLQLAHQQLHRFKILDLRPLLVHAGDEVSCADVVEVIVLDVVAADGAVLANHRIGVLLAIETDVLATIFQIGVEHALQLNTHHVAPFGLIREVEQVGAWRALHLRIGHPLGIVLVGLLLQDQ